jgi:hypothetical protein
MENILVLGRGNKRKSKNNLYWKMSSSGIQRRVGIVRTDISEESISSVFRVEKSAIEEKLSYS